MPSIFYLQSAAVKMTDLRLKLRLSFNSKYVGKFLENLYQLYNYQSFE